MFDNSSWEYRELDRAVAIFASQIYTTVASLDETFLGTSPLSDIVKHTLSKHPGNDPRQVQPANFATCQRNVFPGYATIAVQEVKNALISRLDKQATVRQVLLPSFGDGVNAILFELEK